MMIARNLLIAAAAAALVQIPIGAAQQPGSLPVNWTVAPSGNDASKVQFGISYRTRNNHSQYSRTVPLADLQGLDAAQLASVAGAPVRFRIPREAGTLDCEGIVRRQRGTGECSFVGDERFAAELGRRGIGRPDVHQQFQLAMADVGLPVVAELERQGYQRPSIKDLVSLGIHGAGMSYLRSMDAVGHRVGTVGELVKMRIHGVKPALVREMAALGYTNLGGEQLTKLAIHGVSPGFVRGMHDAGYRNLSIDQLIRLRIHGIKPEDARQANAAFARQ